MTVPVTSWQAPVDDAFERRTAAGSALVPLAEHISAAARDMARRFAAGGTLFSFGAGPSVSDAQHVAVEFLHPVIVGKRAVPSLALPADTSLSFAGQLSCLAGSDDVVLGVAATEATAVLADALHAARQRGALTVALVGAEDRALVADHVLVVPSDDARVVKEIQVTLYHLLWELAHVYLEQPAALEPV